MSYSEGIFSTGIDIDSDSRKTLDINIVERYTQQKKTENNCTCFTID